MKEAGNLNNVFGMDINNYFSTKFSTYRLSTNVLDYPGNSFITERSKKKMPSSVKEYIKRGNILSPQCRTNNFNVQFSQFSFPGCKHKRFASTASSMVIKITLK
jgi:hypothetical protein